VRGRALVVAGLAVATLAGGTGAAVVLRDQPAPAPEPGVDAREPLPDPAPVPERSPLLPAAAPGGEAPQPTAAAIAALVDATVADPALGGRLAASVVDIGARQVVYERDATALLLPASTAKIVTAVAALTTLPNEERLTTRVVAGATPGEVVLVGAGDSTLASDERAQRSELDARLDVLAQLALARLLGTTVTRVVVDDSLYSGPTLAPGWQPNYVPEGSVAPVMALMVDGGRRTPGRPGRAEDPAIAAGVAFAALVARGGPPPEVVRGRARGGAEELAAVQGPPVSHLVERMLSASDNDLAEALARQVAIAEGQPASFDGVARALSSASGRVLEPLGVRADAVRLVDGSGLSRDNALAPGALTRLLTGITGAEPGELSPLLTGLPVAGFDGTLTGRYRAGPEVAGAGVVRAKTGTLRGVSTLAGVVRTADGRLLAFALAADAVPQGAILDAQAALDRLAASLSACGCR
jgi:serine-type D-Ala-D-Ala carboxypeptidase/endopeptidase (penicillin-binding protein 4)